MEVRHFSSCVERYFSCFLCSLVKYFSTLEEKFLTSVLPCNILSLLKKTPMKYQVILCLKHDIFIHEDNMLSSHVLWYFQTLKEKFYVSVPSCNILYISIHIAATTWNSQKVKMNQSVIERKCNCQWEYQWQAHLGSIGNLYGMLLANNANTV